MPSVVVPLATFRTRYPEFDAIDDVLVDLQLGDAESDTSASVFDTLHARAISALAAHRLAISSDEDGNPVGGQPGALEQANVDGVQTTYSIPEGLSAADTALWSTVYGQLFLELRNRCLGGPIVAR